MRHSVILPLLALLFAMPAAHAVVPPDPDTWTDRFSQLLACASGSVSRWRPQPERQALGEFAVRCQGQPAPVFLQAPHGFTDLRTDELARKLFATGEFAALAVSGVPRQVGDQAHVPNASFQLAAGAFWNHLGGVVVQLHGFARDKRDEPAARGADVIISNGSRDVSSPVRHLAACFRDIFPNVLVYPDDTGELGGTTNTVGRHLRSRGHNNFYHLEFSYQARRALAEQQASVKRLGHCLALLGRDVTSDDPSTMAAE